MARHSEEKAFYFSVVSAGRAALTVVRIVLQLADDRLGIDSLTAVIVGQRCPYRLLRQNRTVNFGGRKSVKSGNYGLIAQLQGILEGLSLDEFGGHRTWLRSLPRSRRS